MTEVFGEFIGTAILILLGNGVVAGVVLNKTKSNNAGWLTITFGWGLAVAMAAFVSGTMGPAHLNPAVTLAFAMHGDTPWSQVVPFIIAQMLGAMLGAFLVWLHYRPHYEDTTDQGAILGSFSTAPGIRETVSNVIGEAIGTCMLVLGLLAFGRYDMPAGVGTMVVGSLIVSIGISLGGTTGYAINPARDLGPRLMHAILPIPTKGGNDWEYSWIPVVGPFIGAIVAVLIFSVM